MKKFSEWVMALLFSGTLLILMAATILLPKERYSYYENRNLSAFPEISVESVASGKVFGELETMFCDYAAWRTAALRVVTWCDLNLFHRPVVNEVVVTPDALLEELYTMPDTAEDIVREADTVAADNAALRDQIEAYGGYYCYLAVPCRTPTTRTHIPLPRKPRRLHRRRAHGAPRGHGGAGHRLCGHGRDL